MDSAARNEGRFPFSRPRGRLGSFVSLRKLALSLLLVTSASLLLGGCFEDGGPDDPTPQPTSTPLDVIPASPTAVASPTSTPVTVPATPSPGTATPAPTPGIALGSQVIVDLGATQGDCVDLFLGPSTTERPMACLAKGESGTVTKGPIVVGRERWWLIETPNGVGYIQESFLSPATRVQ